MRRKHKKHILKSLSHGGTSFYPTYCGFFFDFSVCTSKLEEATCKACHKAYANMMRRLRQKDLFMREKPEGKSL